MRFKKATSLCLAGLLAAGLPLAAAQQKAKAKPVQTEEFPQVFEVGKKVDPSIALMDIEGRRHALAGYLADKKPILIDFWSINCPWSIACEPKLKELHAAYKDKGVAFLAIDSNYTEIDPETEDPYGRIRQYVEENEIPYPVLIDHKNVVADRFAAQTTPHIFLIDADGVLRYAGGLDNDPKGDKPAEEVENWTANALDAVLAGKKIALSTTKNFGCTIKRVSADDGSN